MIDIKDMRARLAEYNSEVPRCAKKISEYRNCAPDHVKEGDENYKDFAIVHYVPCCRPTGHEGECRNTRLMLGWPGRAVLEELLNEVEELRAKAVKLDEENTVLLDANAAEPWAILWIKKNKQ